jgi:hypothetical protein
MAAELEHPRQLSLAVRNVHVDVDWQLDRRRLRQAAEAKPRALTAGIGRQPTVARSGGLVVEQLSPELGDARRVFAGERDGIQAKHGCIVSRSSEPRTRTPTLRVG